MTRAGAAVRLLAAACVCVPCLVHAPVVRAQAPDRGVEFEDLGFTEPAEAGSRAVAMRAYVATNADVTALAFGNAGLARVKRVHGALVFAHRRLRLGVDYGGGMEDRETGETHLAFAGVAFPLPVLRGSLVPALSIHRAFSSARDLSYSRDNAAEGRSENYSLSQTGATYAYSLGFGTDLSSTLSAGVSVFLLDGRVDALRQFDWQPLVADPDVHTFVLEDTESEVGGYGVRVGVQLYLHERLHLGAQFHSPTLVNVHSVQVREETRQVENDVGSFVRTRAEIDTEYILPYRVEGALAATLGPLLLSAQVSYANWSDAAVDGRRVFTQSADPVLRRVIGFSAGAELSVPYTPLCARAGYAYAPAPLKYIQTDRIDNDAIRRVAVESGRASVSAGAALLIRSRLVLDAAWVLTTGSREAALLRDEHRSTQVLLQGTYWF